jgi:hypothetical protein
MALMDMKVFGDNDGYRKRVLKELWYRQAEMLEAMEEMAKWWRYNLV